MCRQETRAITVPRESYKYPTPLQRISYDVINIVAIFSHGISMKKKLAYDRRRRFKSPSCQ